LIEQIEGPRTKTPTKKSNSKGQSKSTPFLEERAELETRVKNRLRKIKQQKKNKKTKFQTDIWTTKGASKSLILPSSWNELQDYVLKINSYPVENFERPDTAAVSR
jgi:hypothetical protein